jgi:integrase/recombinase XerD
MAAIYVFHKGISLGLRGQIRKILRHCNQGSYKTRHRYEEAADRFSKFLADEFHLQKFTNVQDKHIRAYVGHMQERGLSASTIKTDLSAIRFLYDQSGGRNRLPENSELDLERRHFGGVYRAWKDDEFEAALDLAEEMGDHRVRWALTLARHLGLRIHEVVRLSRAQLLDALRTGTLHNLKGKGGKLRDIALTPGAKVVIAEIVKATPVGDKAFVMPDEQAHQVIKHIQSWIGNHRNKFTDRKVTIHGLRHRYAQERYAEALERYGDEYQARKEVSRWLGHERDEVTRVYLCDEETSRRSV